MKINIQDDSRELKKIARLVNKGLFKDPTQFVREAVNHYYKAIVEQELAKAALAQNELMSQEIAAHVDIQLNNEESSEEDHETVGRLAAGSR